MLRSTHWVKPWIVAVFFQNGDGSIELESSRFAKHPHRGYTNRIVCNFPCQIYDKNRLPMRRIEIDLFPELKNHTQNPQR